MAAPACASTARSLAAAAALPPVRALRIPHLVPYALGTALQEHLHQRRANARAYVKEQPTPSPVSRLGQLLTAGGGGGSSSKDRDAQARQVTQTDHLLLLEHTPVFTEGKRKKERDPELAAVCERLGIDYVLARRGGLITYHGPGQITGYPLLDLGLMDLSIKCYVSYLEKVFRALLSDPSTGYNLSTVEPPDAHTGVWADEYHKIVSLGVQVRDKLTLDGFGFNVTDGPLAFFRLIVACGIQGRYMTSLWSELRKQAERDGEGSTLGHDKGAASDQRKPSPQAVMSIVAEHSGRQFGRSVEDVAGDEVQYELSPQATPIDSEGRTAPKLSAITLYGDRIETSSGA